MPLNTLEFAASMESGGFTAEAQKIINSIGEQVTSITKLIATSEKFNEKTGETTRMMKIELDTVRTLTVKWKELSAAKAAAQSHPDFIGPPEAPFRILETKSKARKQRPEDFIGPPREPFDVAQGISAAEKARILFPAPTNATITQLAKYEAQIAKIQNLVQSGKVSMDRFQQILAATQVKGGLAQLKLTGDEAKLASALGQITTGFKTATAESERFGLSMQNVFRIGQAIIFHQALNLIIGTIQQAIKSAVEFQIKISEIRTLATENQSSFEAWSGSIAKVSDELGIPQVQVAKTAYEALSAQIVSGREETIEFTKAAGDLARVGVSSIEASGKVLSSVFNAYGIGIGRAEEISAKLFVAVDRGNFTIEQLGSHLGRVTGAASAMGIEFEEMLGALTTLSRTSNPADSITQLTNVILKLQKPGESTKALLKGWGYESGQAAINALGFVGVLKKIEEAVKGDASALAEFGQELRAIRGLTGLTQGGKGGQFAADVAALQADPTAAFRQAKKIRAESAGDELTKEFNKISNYFTNEFGQSIINAVLPVTKAFKVLGDDVGTLSGTVKFLVSGATQLGAVIGTYIITTKLATVSTNIFSASMTKLGIDATRTGKEITFAGKAVNVFGSSLKGLANVATFLILMDQAIEFGKEMKGLNKHAEEYDNVLKRIENKRKGKTEDDKSVGGELFKDRMLKESARFTEVTDNLFKPLLQQEAEAVRKANELLQTLREEGQESAVQLQVAFKATTDAIDKTVRSYADNISKANKTIEDSKKNILTIRETLQGIIFDLKMDFASENQKFELRAREIQRLEAESERLFKSDDPADLAKAQQLGMQALQQRRDFAREAGRAEVEAIRAQRTAMGVGEGSRFPDNRPIQPTLDPHIKEIEKSAARMARLQEEAANRGKTNITSNEKLLKVEKDRERLSAKRIADLLKLQVVDDAGNLKKEFTTTTGKFDENKFNIELKKRFDLMNQSLTAEERKLIGLNELEEVRLNLIKQGQAAAEAAVAIERQRAIEAKGADIKGKFEQASKQRIEASQAVDSATKDFAAIGDLLSNFAKAAKSDESIFTIGDDMDPIRKQGARIVQGLLQAFEVTPAGLALSATGGKLAPVSERSQIFQNNKELVATIQRMNEQFNRATEKLSQRDASGKITATSADIEDAKAKREILFNTIDELIQKFQPGLTKEQRSAFAPQRGAALRELRSESDLLFAKTLQAVQQEQTAAGTQEQLRQELVKIFGPAQAAAAQFYVDTKGQLSQIMSNTAGIVNLPGAIMNAVRQLAPANVPAAPLPPFGGPQHYGGLLTGPAGYDNLYIRAEAGEYVVNQKATKKWLPQLIAMNNGRDPKIPGRYHEGGLVQTNVGDVNVTITGPVSPEKNVREIGKALRRSIRRGNLDLTSKR